MSSKAERKRRKHAARYEQHPPSRRFAFIADPHPLAPRPRNELLIHQLHASAELNLDSDGLTLERTDGPDTTESIVFVRGGQRLLYLFADEAVAIHGTRRVRGNFHDCGEHWQELRALLLELQGEDQHLLNPLPELRELRTSFSASMAPALAAAGLAASIRIRAQRDRANGHPVVLESESYVVRFEPLRKHPPLLAPFMVTDADGESVHGALDLASTADVIALRFAGPEAERLALAAWPVALLAFADMACPAEAAERAPKSIRSRERGEQARKGMSGEGNRVLPRRSGGPRRSSGGGKLTPFGDQVGHRGSHVSGHRRRLRPGEHAGEEAQAAARAVGIQLGDGFTWVVPHDRGIPKDYVFRYAWRAPATIAGTKLRWSADNPRTPRSMASRAVQSPQ